MLNIQRSILNFHLLVISLLVTGVLFVEY